MGGTKTTTQQRTPTVVNISPNMTGNSQFRANNLVTGDHNTFRLMNLLLNVKNLSAPQQPASLAPKGPIAPPSIGTGFDPTGKYKYEDLRTPLDPDVNTRPWVSKCVGDCNGFWLLI